MTRPVPSPRTVHRGSLAAKQLRANAAPGAATPDKAAPPHGTRTCSGCGQKVEGGRDVLVRLVFGPEGELAIDSGEGAFGRGVYVHPIASCVKVAGSRGLARRRPRDGDMEEPLTIDGLPLSTESLRDAVTAAYQRRLGGLFGAARRTRTVVFGADAVCAALGSGEAALVLVAADAAAAADRTEVRAAIAAGRAASWGTKRELGELLGGGREDGVGVAAFLDGRIAAAVRDAVHVVDGLRPEAPGSRDAGSRELGC